MRSNDTAKETLLFQTGENNPQAIEDVRNHVDLCARTQSGKSSCMTLLRSDTPFGPTAGPTTRFSCSWHGSSFWGDINLMMDGALLPPDKAFEPMTTPAKRRKIIVVKRQTAKPEDVKNARNLGKELFAEMGPDSEDGLFSFLQRKLKEWQTSLTTYKTLAETGNYPGNDEITDGLTLINKPLTDKESPKFLDRFNTLRKDLIEFAEHYHDLENFLRTPEADLGKAAACDREVQSECPGPGA